MENLFSKRWFRWAVLILTAINLSMIAGFTYTAYVDKPQDNFNPNPPAPRPNAGLGRMLRNELDLSRRQHLQFRDARKAFHRDAHDITVNLQQTRLKLLKEMSKDQPQKERMKTLADSIGIYHSRLKMHTIDFYMQLKQNCTPEQEEKLKGIFRKLMNAREIKMPGGPRHHRRGFNK